MKLCSLFASRVVVCSKVMRDLFIAFGLSDHVDIIQNVVYLDNKNIDDNIKFNIKIRLIYRKHKNKIN